VKCPKCGTEVVKGEKACWQCYTPLEGDGAQQPAGAPHVSAAKASPAPRRSGGRKLAVAIAVVVLAAGGGVFYYTQYMSPAACARAFCSAIERGDAKAMYAQLSAEDRKDATAEDMEPMMDAMKQENAPKVTITLQEVTREGAIARAKVAYAMKMGEGPNAMDFSTTMPLIMVREGMSWRVSMKKTSEEQMKAMGITPDMFDQPGAGPVMPTE
jgi:uncharacterized membrane protein YvbJ